MFVVGCCFGSMAAVHTNTTHQKGVSCPQDTSILNNITADVQTQRLKKYPPP
jgi:hypothetical protein